MYQVTFIDGTEFTGGEPNNTLWDTLPNLPIKSLTCWLNEDLKFKFSDFEEYASLVERCQIFNQGSLKPTETVTKWVILGRVGARVYEIVYNLQKGKVYQLVTKYGAEYSNQEIFNKEGEFIGWHNGKAVGGWLQGVLNDGSGPGPKLKRIVL